LVDSILGKECVGALDVRVYKSVLNIEAKWGYGIEGGGKEEGRTHVAVAFPSCSAQKQFQAGVP
jgi:hypothetical protein